MLFCYLTLLILCIYIKSYIYAYIYIVILFTISPMGTESLFKENTTHHPLTRYVVSNSVTHHPISIYVVSNGDSNTRAEHTIKPDSPDSYYSIV